jgi:NAD(P)-dependent dehydrogenase (short-subunit alcohol dehydrogenase family)
MAIGGFQTERPRARFRGASCHRSHAGGRNDRARRLSRRRGRPKGYGVYGASKAAVRSFARTWANELAPKGIRVNVVSPGPTDTAMFAGTPDEVRDALTKLIPLGRLGRPEEVAAAALILASDDSSFTTGAELCVDGGMTQV